MNHENQEDQMPNPEEDKPAISVDNPRPYYGFNLPPPLQPIKRTSTPGHFQRAQMAQHAAFVRRTSPTVIDEPNFEPYEDSKILWKAINQRKMNSIIDLLTKRSNFQRLVIQQNYFYVYEVDLMENIQSITSGNFNKLLVAMLTPVAEMFARELHYTMYETYFPSKHIFMEILCFLPNREIEDIRTAYNALYETVLERHLESRYSGGFLKVLLAWCRANRNESTIVNETAAVKDASDLFLARKYRNRDPPKESTFINILSTRSSVQLNKIFEEYEKLADEDIGKSIKKEFSGDLRECLLTIVDCAKNRHEYYAKELNKCLCSFLPRNKLLIRLTLVLVEMNMGEVKAAYSKLFPHSLHDHIKLATNGDYRKCLLALIG